MIESIKGRVALVTGAASGIGFGLAQALGDAGALLALADVDRPALDAAAVHFRSAGAEVLPLAFDVRDAIAWGSAAARIEAELGSVSLLLSNAGVLGSRLPLERTSVDTWRWTFDISVTGETAKSSPTWYKRSIPRLYAAWMSMIIRISPDIS